MLSSFCFGSFLQPGDKVHGLPGHHGGHLTHQARSNALAGEQRGNIQRKDISKGIITLSTWVPETRGGGSVACGPGTPRPSTQEQHKLDYLV